MPTFFFFCARISNASIHRSIASNPHCMVHTHAHKHTQTHLLYTNLQYAPQLLKIAHPNFANRLSTQQSPLKPPYPLTIPFPRPIVSFFLYFFFTAHNRTRANKGRCFHSSTCRSSPSSKLVRNPLFFSFFFLPHTRGGHTSRRRAKNNSPVCSPHRTCVCMRACLCVCVCVCGLCAPQSSPRCGRVSLSLSLFVLTVFCSFFFFCPCTNKNREFTRKGSVLPSVPALVPRLTALGNHTTVGLPHRHSHR